MKETGPRPGGEELPTDAVIEHAALRLLQRDGVLAGLNLREVADEAGVNRGLVYHYFGSRQRLLRSALRRDAHRRLEAVAAGFELPIRERFTRFLALMVRQRSAVEMVSLLVLDRFRDLRFMPLRAETLEALRRDRERGQVDLEDLEALHVALVSLVYGYVVYRSAMADEIGVSPQELDKRVSAVFDRLLRGLEPR